MNTIRGPIEVTELGRTLAHEHLATGTAEMERRRHAPPLDTFEAAAAMLAQHRN